MIISDIGLIDTNILVYIVNKTSQFHKAAFTLRTRALKGEIPLCVTPQIFSEFYAVAANPRRIEIPLSQADIIKEIEGYLFSDAITKIFYKEDTLNIFLDLLRRYPAQSQKIFDLQLVATMLSNNISRIYTYNIKDFIKYSEIEVVSPESVIH